MSTFYHLKFAFIYSVHKMKNILYTIILSFLFSSSVFADWKAGLDAYNAGDFQTALKNWIPLAEQGYAKAQYNLGVMHYHGQGVTQDYKEALKWHRLATEQGHANAQLNLAGMYYHGQGVTQDYKEALKWTQLAAEQGHANAQYNLGLLYAKELGVIKDYVIAHMWFNIAVSNGNEAAKTSKYEAESLMTSEQIVKAQELARECIKKNYKDCG
jgi:TPR repeat protein